MIRNGKEYLTTGEFAKLCGTTKETLRHYKNVGILRPALSAENNYFYYEPGQFFDYYLIHILKKTGTPLSEIKSYMHQQEIHKVLNLLHKQQRQLKEERLEIERMERVVARSISNIEMGISEIYATAEPQILQFPEEHLIAVTVDGLDPEEDLAFVALIHKYASICQKYGLETDYHTGAIISQQNFLAGDFTFDRIYTKIDKPSKNPYYMKKIAGDYLAILVRGWEIEPSYQKVISYIDEHHLALAGDVFAYDVSGYLLNSREENTMTLVSFRVEVP